MAIERRHRNWAFAALAGLAVALVLWAVLHTPPKTAAPPPPIPVSAAHAARQDLPVLVSALGAAQAWTSDTILAQVTGKLLRVNFTEGSLVRAGEVLAEVDPAPYRAVLEQDEGSLRRDRAILAGAQRDLARYQTLEKQDSIARQTAEDEAATVAQDEGTVQIDKGAVEAALVNLRWCRIVSPISGRAGVRLVDPGNIVSASGSTASTPSTAAATNVSSAAASTGSGIVIINKIQPIAVTFTVPEGDFERISLLSNGFRTPMAIQAFSQETGALLDSGGLSIADNKVDPATGTVELKARFANAVGRLWPGQFVDVKIAADVIHGATVIPASAVNRGPKGQFAFVVGPDGRAAMRPLTIVGSQGALTAVTGGIKPGDVVVTDGQMTLKAGSPVRVAQWVPLQAGP